MPSPDVLVLGGGVIGLTTAYFLARERVRVLVLDQGDFGQESSWAGAGIISPGNPRRARSAIGQLRGQSAALWPQLSAELKDRTGIDNGYWRCGGLELRRSEDALEKQRLDNLLREERGEGAHCEVLDQARLLALESELAQTLPGAVLLPELAQVRNPRHIRALVNACASLGVELHSGCPAHGFEQKEEQITGVLTPNGRLSASRYLVCAGAWTDRLLNHAGIELGVHPVRGQIVLLHTDPSLLRHVLLTGSQYLVPRADGRILVGSTEEQVGFDKRTTAQAVQELLALATSLVPALAHAPVERCWAGLRPGSPDGKPFLGAAPGFDNLLIAAGHYRSGLQNSPGTAQVMMELLLGRIPSIGLEPFRVDRHG
jgi:glycine oxidase